MCSLDGWSLLWSDASNTKQAPLGQSSEDDIIWCLAFSFIGRLVAYIVLLGALIVVISLIMRFIFGECEGDQSTSIADNHEPVDTQPILSDKTISITYGTCDNHDIEAGNCSSSKNNSNSSDQSSEDLYDGKICVICFDEPRNCFFVPCGHCATCHGCAIRIFYGETRTCPMCRRFVGKVRKIYK